MPEFVEVMKQWGRLCEAHCRANNDDCDGCILGGTWGDDVCGSYARDNAKNCKEIERIVMGWAAEHAEPVYPTWVEWFDSMGGVDCGDPIPADIAEKLGIEPKEVI